MDVETEKLFGILQRNPKLYIFLENKQALNILEEIYKTSQNIYDLKRKASFKNNTTLYNILNILLETNFIKKTTINNIEIYAIDEQGKQFIELLKNIEKKVKI